MSPIKKSKESLLKSFFKLFRRASSDSDKAEKTCLSKSILQKKEEDMIQGIFALDQKEVREIMVPRMDMACLDEKFSLKEIKDIIEKERHSRFPLIKGNMDNVEGIVYVKDLFLNAKGEENLDLKRLARKAYFVPESKKLDKLLDEMRKARVHIAIVVDEYGGTSGLVTLEDILEEIVGEIRDEYDTEEEPIKKIDENTFKVDAKLSLEDLGEALGVKMNQGQFETVGGLIYDLLGGVPSKGEVIRKDNLQFCVEKVEGQRIKTVRVTKLAAKKEDEK